MKRLAAMALCAVLSAPVSALDPAVLMPSPITVLLTVGKWMMQDRQEVYYVKVRARGNNEQDARDQAFRLAVEQAVGSLLLSHTQVGDGEVRRREIINYSSGHIHDFKISDRQYINNQVSIDIDVWVKKSSIADRLLSESRDTGRVEGGRISAQIKSFHQEKQTADRVLESVLEDYPKRAFDLSVGKTRVLVENRQTYLQVPVQVSWNKKFLQSMGEAIATVDPNPQCSGWLSNCQNKLKISAGGKVGHFDDEKTYWIFDKALIAQRTHILMKLLDSSNNTVFQDCFLVPEISMTEYAPWHFVNIGNRSVRFDDSRQKRVNLLVDIGKIPVDNLDRADVEMVPGNQCPR